MYTVCHLYLHNSVEEITECIDFQPIRVNYYSTSDISRLFQQVHPSSIVKLTGSMWQIE